MSVWFVSGGSRGLGRGMVLAAAAAGHDVAFTWVSREDRADAVVAEAHERAPDRTVRSYRLDVADPEAVEEVGDRVLDDFQEVHTVVANAGINRTSLAVSMSDEDWLRVLAVNLTGAFFVARRFLPTMLANRHGRLIFISSLARQGISGQANYSASKAGLVGLSMALAKEYGSKGITSNTVVPGPFETDMTRETMSQANEDFWNRFCPAGRMGRDADLTALILFLASDEAGFINGQTISVTGGLDWVL